jgi:hypothetical protein
MCHLVATVDVTDNISKTIALAGNYTNVWTQNYSLGMLSAVVFIPKSGTRLVGASCAQ